MKSFLPRLKPIAEAALLGALGARFFYLVLSGKILYYVHPRWFWVLTAGWLLIAALCAFQLLRRSGHMQTRPALFLPACLLCLWLIALPVRPLETKNRLAEKPPASAAMTDEMLPADTGGYEMRDWYLYSISGSPRPELEGKAFHASGFVASYDTGAGTFELGRLVVTCCTADSFLTTITVDPGDLDSAKLISDAWYDVTGHWRQEGGVWRIRTDEIAPIAVPDDPYVYP